MIVDVHGERIALLPERAVFWERERLLLVADVHLGKAETFQKAGVPIASAVHDEDLARLAQAAARTRADRIVFLGDLFHGPAASAPSVVDGFARFRAQVTARLTLVRGNHERRLDALLARLPLELWPEGTRVGPFRFFHEAPKDEESDTFSWEGHRHPVVATGRGADRLRLPCFLLGAKRGCLPAFGAFTGGSPLERNEAGRVFLVAETRVVPWLVNGR